VKFRIVSIVFVVTAIALFLAINNLSTFTVVFVILLLVYGGVIALGSYRFQWNFFMPAIHHGKKGSLCITFDDGPHPEHTQAILDILAKYKAPATFFMIGKNVDAHPAIVKQVQQQGHEIGNHSYHHSNMHGFLSTKGVVSEIEKCSEAIMHITEEAVEYYRPPFGVTNPNIADAVKQTGMPAIGWDIRSLDTTATDADKLLARITNAIPTGTILLLHDTQPITVQILPAILDFCAKNNIEIIPLNSVVQV